MGELLFFVKKLYAVTGKKLFLNIGSMITVSLLDGISIYLLVPMLGIIGFFQIDAAKSLPIPGLSHLLQNVQSTLNLPIILAMYVLIIAGQALLQRSQAIRSSQIQQHFIRHLRFETYRALMQAKWDFFLVKRKSDFSHILTTELARVNQGTNMFMQLITSAIFTAIQIGLAFWLSAKLTSVILVSGIVIFVVFRKYVRKAQSIGDRTTELSQSYYAGITEHFNGIKDIKSNRLEHIHLTWFHALCKQIEDNVTQFIRLNSTTQFLSRITAAVLIVLFIYVSFGVFHTPAEQMMVIIIIFARLWPRFSSIQSSLETMVSMFPAFKSVIQLQQECKDAQEWSVQKDRGISPAIPVEHGIECRDVCFRYSNDQHSYALHDINIHIPAGGLTAIVGRSGAGKSTLIDILMGLMQPESGQMLIDGVPLTPDKFLPLRSSISYVSQDPFLFHMSIRDNLKLVNPAASEQEMWEALEFSASAEFVSKLPQGLDTVVGDRGVRLSGGERQRIVLARAILRKPSILILDEATSALDGENELKVQQAIDRLKGKMTIIVIAHRLSTIRGADQVIVLDKGELIQQGGYQQLSQETRGIFSKLLGYQIEARA
ncbi:ABC transporter ATP-binding protein [Paenibacillus sedimenti]|uniref:ABC transporter ATP-binding protein n=1 Tax=Paenibacillus sedimenti TaxID=2770274 RepID=A0A926QHN8_9BACL|nr:ABC transporter ATP-binding protein [Paenibacillus sedimenti]MBD0379751.1 ABC transporter ATP-binding protein [Paenibacillus sedimenti]